jgi:hypothetical protein
MQMVPLRRAHPSKCERSWNGVPYTTSTLQVGRRAETGVRGDISIGPNQQRDPSRCGRRCGTVTTACRQRPLPSLNGEKRWNADEVEAEARERKVRRGRIVEPNQEQRVPGSRRRPVRALAATPCDFAIWKLWLDSINKKLDLGIPDVPLLQRDLREHFLPPKHREKNTDMPWNCCVARPVYKEEIRRSAGARKALRKEWDRLRLINTWREDLVEEWDAVKARAKKAHTPVHVGVVLQICVEKDSETEKPERERKCKGRVVFRGNDVVDEHWDVAMFRELGSAPATMVAAKACDLYGLLEGHIIENADAAQAYTQSLLGGAETWVSLPREEWPESWRHM